MKLLNTLDMVRNQIINFVFHNSIQQPENAVQGQGWFDSNSGSEHLKVMKNSSAGFKALAYTDDPPASHNHNDLYYTESEVNSLLGGKASSTHVHGNISNDGKVGSTSGKILTTGTGGAVQTSDTISESQVSGLNNDLAAKQDKAPVSGYDLISGNKINTYYLPDSVLGQLEYKGTWNAASPTVVSSPEKGWYYICATAGGKNPSGSTGTNFAVGDWAVYNGSSWDKVDNTDEVSSVNDKKGAVVLSADDVGAYAKDQTYTKTEVNSAIATQVSTNIINALGAIRAIGSKITTIDHTAATTELKTHASAMIDADEGEFIGVQAHTSSGESVLINSTITKETIGGVLSSVIRLSISAPYTEDIICVCLYAFPSQE